MAIVKSQSNFLSSDGKNRINYFCWCDDKKEPKAVFQIAHGMAEYIDRYDAFARFLAANGFKVYGDDHLGHGLSAASEEDLGFIADKDGYKLMVKDLHTLTEIAKKDTPGKPFVFMGHSMGSFLARYYASLYSNEIDALIIMGTSGSNPLGGIGMLLVNIISVFKGERYRSAFIENMASGGYTKKFDDVRTPFDWLSVNRDNVTRYVNDELCGFRFTLSAYRDLMKLLGAVSKPGWASTLRSDLPVLLVSGKDDPVGNYGAGVEEVYSKLQNAGVERVGIKLYDGLRHEILNEDGREEVYGDLLSWCTEAIK